VAPHATRADRRTVHGGVRGREHVSSAMLNAPSPTPYFEETRTLALILGSFFVVFLPLALLHVFAHDWPGTRYLAVGEAVGLGVTHFFITLAVYFRGDTLDHFASTRRNRLAYLYMPLVVFLVFATLAAIDVRRVYPMFAAAFFGTVRFFDFFHVGRQSFGMLQILKRPLGARAPEHLRAAENTFFVAMAALQWETFVVGGAFAETALYARLPALALAVLAAIIAVGYLRLLPHAGRAAWIPLSYFLMQAVCAACAAWQTPLYLIALTLHYVEYHVIMAPRCFRLPLDPARGIDRAFAPVRARPWLFYAILLAVVVLFEQRDALAPGSPAARFLVHIFDGIFVVHYLIEAFLWKFREPYYRRTLAPLYFPPTPADGTR
jgi:hypothetical protein